MPVHRRIRLYSSLLFAPEVLFALTCALNSRSWFKDTWSLSTGLIRRVVLIRPCLCAVHQQHFRHSLQSPPWLLYTPRFSELWCLFLHPFLELIPRHPVFGMCLRSRIYDIVHARGDQINCVLELTFCSLMLSQPL